VRYISVDFCVTKMGGPCRPLSCLASVDEDKAERRRSHSYKFSHEKSFKLPVVHFDEYLSFESHITRICTKISKFLYCLDRIKNFVTPAAMKMLYFAVVRSHIVYCLNIYSCANITVLSPLKSMS
jgi:hypothetical protein